MLLKWAFSKQTHHLLEFIDFDLSFKALLGRLHFGGKMSGAVDGVSARPSLEGLLTVKKYQLQTDLSQTLQKEKNRILNIE